MPKKVKPVATPTTVTLSLRLPADQHRALVGLHARDGVPVTESIRRAIAAWLDAKKAYPPPPRVKGRKS
jgi:hypothetical protein